ncbi:hypothetical protein PoB_004638800 [Plakobranchus ocellatus]|uniref:Uncharacterized protein n=1 Tax=Plakobranchus ocellatus TaxID=259542 RepID=A0AAV4BJW3_9GAST|nr:hypothetical protein PoB_004638800 [Plakobranchus ocellatus]
MLSQFFDKWIENFRHTTVNILTFILSINIILGAIVFLNFLICHDTFSIFLYLLDLKAITLNICEEWFNCHIVLLNFLICHNTFQHLSIPLGPERNHPQHL